MEYREIDMRTYPRRAHFDYFRAMAYPYVGLTAEVDVTNVVRRAKEQGNPFFLTLLHAAGNAANDVPSFRQRIRGDGIVEYARCPTSHTVMKPDGTYVYCASDPSLPLPEFLEETAKRQAEAIKSGALREEVGVEALFFISCLPWMSYTALVQPVPRPADSNPRITWGKYFDRDGRKILPLSVLVNHALVDGKQIADFYDRLRERT
ncbi:MAG: chloramphenicol acetyltransferase [Clostridiales bacterium]|nr:chloramphenicol acetyltransferase [Clostridiales bacterium]